MKDFLVIITLLLTITTAHADEMRLAYLQFQQTDSESYDVLWKVPGRGNDERLALNVEFPSSCKILTPAHASMINNAFIQHWSIKCAGSLTGNTTHVTGLSDTSTDVLVRLERLDHSSQIVRLTASSQSFVLQAEPDTFDIAHTYLVLGIEHILTGFDHLLFVLALLLIVGQRWNLLIKTITAFTLAHSITLAMSTLGFVHVPSAPVEAMIALSIVFVAAEILHACSGYKSLTSRAPWVVAFVFGLLHGFGFASALGAVGLPQNSIPLALLLFNVGVELGQLLFVAVAIFITMGLRHLPVKWPPWSELVTPYMIGSYATFCFIKLIMQF